MYPLDFEEFAILGHFYFLSALCYTVAHEEYNPVVADKDCLPDLSP